VKYFDIIRLGYTYTHVVYIPRAMYPYIMQELSYLILFNPS